MAYAVNRTPLLRGEDSDSTEEREIEQENHIDDIRPLFKPPEPKDKYYMSYLIFYLLGITTLLPWNFYVTADDYWMHKFRNVSNNASSLTTPGGRTPLQAEFTSYLSLASSVPNLIFLIFNTAISQRVSLNKRVLGSLFFMFLLMLVTLGFVNIDTDNWQQGFFWTTIVCVLLLNVCSAIFSGSIFGIVGKFSPSYITAVTGGQALGGVFAAIAQIISLAIGASSVHSAMVYFIIGNATILLTIACYCLLVNSMHFKFHTGQLLHGLPIIINESYRAESSSDSTISHKIILRKMWSYGMSVFFTFAVTLAVYPGVTVLIESEGKGQGNKWNDLFFVPTIAYLLANMADYSGRLLAGRILKPKNMTLLTILSISRFIFIPLLLLCNAQPRKHLAVVFGKDAQYIAILFTFLFTNGYLANLIAILVPKVVDHHEKVIASSIMMVFLGIGLTLGSALSLFMVRLL